MFAILVFSFLLNVKGIVVDRQSCVLHRQHVSSIKVASRQFVSHIHSMKKPPITLIWNFFAFPILCVSVALFHETLKHQSVLH